jgi:hypothetical protein
MEGAPDGWVPTEVAIVKGVTLRVVWVGALLAVGADVYWTPDAMAPAYWFPSTPE